ncbi:MAG: hypothetical protein H0X53_03280 [Sphingomonas sp.]|nr:hypothetical protein [Sphingomonas sp.]
MAVEDYLTRRERCTGQGCGVVRSGSYCFQNVAVELILFEVGSLLKISNLVDLFDAPPHFVFGHREP